MNSFNPASALLTSLRVITERAGPNEQEIIQIAENFLETWVLQWTVGLTGSPAISRKATRHEEQQTADATLALVSQLSSLGLSTEDRLKFDQLIKSTVASITDPSAFADGSTNEFVANTLCWAATNLIFFCKESNDDERLYISALAIVFFMSRFGEWLSERT